MAIIHVNFRDRDFYSVKREVIEKLDEWGLHPEKVLVPRDAVACALDEVRLYDTYQERNNILTKLEELLVKPLSP